MNDYSHKAFVSTNSGEILRQKERDEGEVTNKRTIGVQRLNEGYGLILL